jgi:hypothetical protein
LQFLASKKEKEYKLLKIYIKKYENKIKAEKKAISNIDKQINDIAGKVEYLYRIKTKKPLYNEFADIINFLNKNGLKLISFEIINNKYNILIESDIKSGKLIPKFIKYLITLGYKDISSKEIINKNNNYITQIKYNNE